MQEQGMIQLYWKNASDKVVGSEHGVSMDEIEAIKLNLCKASQAVQKSLDSGQYGYADLPTHPTYAASVKALVEKHRATTTDLVVLGIGGSALGNIALQSALNPATYNLLSDAKRPGPRLFVLDNVDPALVSETLKVAARRGGKGLLVNVISKSGETAETASQFMVVRDLLKKKLGDDFAKHIVATTDAEKGTLHSIAKADGYDMLEVPGNVGGRFSVLSPVGLFSAAMCGIDIDELLAGAEAMRERLFTEHCMGPGCLLAAVKYLMMKKGKPIHVMMPYTNRLYMMADWYRQLWAESLGKQFDRDGNEVFAGATPVKALGTTDQHSQVQLYREGPNDKLTIFLEVKKHARDVRIPDDFADIPGLSYLRKAKLSKLLNAEKVATEYAMAKSQRPSLTITFPEITPHTVGQFIMLYEYTTSMVGELLNIDAYDQPAVELGKQATFALMGREGYDEMAREMKSFSRTDKKYLV
jgi:glucose-6-phosphate isomerase